MATKEVKIIKPTVANANNNLIRMAAYCRVSTDSADQVNSFKGLFGNHRNRPLDRIRNRQ